MSSKRQAIIWSDDGLVYWRICVLLGHAEWTLQMNATNTSHEQAQFLTAKFDTHFSFFRVPFILMLLNSYFAHATDIINKISRDLVDYVNGVRLAKMTFHIIISLAQSVIVCLYRAGIILCMGSANGRRRYCVTSLIDSFLMAWRPYTKTMDTATW